MRPVVCFDESLKQLIAEVRKPLPPEPGTTARYDTEYKRKGICDLMMICEPERGFRQVDITDRRTRIKFALCMKHIADSYPQTNVIRVVLITLTSTKSEPSTKPFQPNKRTIWREDWNSITLPKQGSWLNIAEIELAGLSICA